MGLFKSLISSVYNNVYTLEYGGITPNNGMCFNVISVAENNSVCGLIVCNNRKETTFIPHREFDDIPIFVVNRLKTMAVSCYMATEPNRDNMLDFDNA